MRRRRLLVALVVTGDAAHELDGLRRALGAPARGRIPPHVTLVPPRNTAVGDDEVLAHLRGVASGFAALELVLGPPESFAPTRPVLFLAVTHPELPHLALRLAAGPFAPPAGRMALPFVAHVTLATGLAPGRLDASLTALADYRRTVVVESLSLLEQDPVAPTRPWHERAVVGLGRAAVVGRGGRELAFEVASRLDPGVAAFLDAASAVHAAWSPVPVATREPVALVARHGGDVVAAATGALVGSEFVLERLAVAPTHRSTGVASQLLARLERLARDRGATALTAEVESESAGAALLIGRGFATVAGVPGSAGVAPRVVVRRGLLG